MVSLSQKTVDNKSTSEAMAKLKTLGKKHLRAPKKPKKK